MRQIWIWILNPVAQRLQRSNVNYLFHVCCWSFCFSTGSLAWDCVSNKSKWSLKIFRILWFFKIAITSKAFWINCLTPSDSFATFCGKAFLLTVSICSSFENLVCHNIMTYHLHLAILFPSAVLGVLLKFFICCCQYITHSRISECIEYTQETNNYSK